MSLTSSYPAPPEEFQAEVERRADSFRIKLRSMHIFSRIVNFLASLSLAPFFLSVFLLVIGFGVVLVQALTSSGYAGKVLDEHAYWFMPIWYTTWHLFFVLVCATLVNLFIVIPPVVFFASRMLWAIPQHFFWQAFLPGRSWAMTEQTLRAQVQDDIDQAAVKLCLERDAENNDSRPVFAILLYNAIMIGYFVGTYSYFYNKINNTTGHYFCWGLNSFHTADIKPDSKD